MPIAWIEYTTRKITPKQKKALAKAKYTESVRSTWGK